MLQETISIFVKPLNYLIMYRKDVNSFGLPKSDYYGTMEQLKDRYAMHTENPGMSTVDTQNLMRTLNPNINPGGSQGLIGGLERIIDTNGY